jgi:site-specific recombinase XerD
MWTVFGQQSRSGRSLRRRLKGRQPPIAPKKTVAGYRGLLDVVILPKWRDEPLRNIGHERIQDWVSWLSTDPVARNHEKKGDEKAGLSPARVIQIHQVVHQVFGYAIRAIYLAVNPANHVELPRKPQSKDLALSHEQVRTLTEEMANAEVRHRSDTVASLLSPRNSARWSASWRTAVCGSVSASRCG